MSAKQSNAPNPSLEATLREIPACRVKSLFNSEVCFIRGHRPKKCREPCSSWAWHIGCKGGSTAGCTQRYGASYSKRLTHVAPTQVA